MTRKQSTERLWPPSAEDKKEKDKPLELRKTESQEEFASFTLDAEAVARALAPTLKKCPACEPCKSIEDSKKDLPKFYGHLNVREGVLILIIAVFAFTTLICALICVSISSKSSQAIIKLESLLRR